MDVIYSAVAMRDLRKLPKADAKRIRDALVEVAQRHPERLNYVTELVGQASMWRLRKGDWRAVYHQSADTIEVLAVRKRGEAYR